VVIADTIVWIDYLRSTNRSETDWLEAELDRQRLGLTEISSSVKCYGRPR
jgi:hypothetical protein